MGSLPAGLVIHCENCGIVIPADAPRPEGGDCAFVARNKLAHFRSSETVRGQHTMATAAWHMIYHRAIDGPTPDASAVAYMQRYRTNPKQHFVSSVARRALTPEQVTAQMGMNLEIQIGERVVRIDACRRDAHFYAD